MDRKSIIDRDVMLSRVEDDTPFTWSYLAGSDLKSSLAYPNGLTASWAYDNRNNLTQVKNATATNTISQYDYDYDAANRRTSVTKSGVAFAQTDTVDYGYNSRSELTNAIAQVDADYNYSYDFDDIGNREAATERGTNTVYAANALNQYTSISSALEGDFIPQFDADGNQTLVKTATGIWQVQYNGENRPVRWVNGGTVVTMSFDRMGRRVTENAQRFVYNGYLQIAERNSDGDIVNAYIWDPTEPVATRPLAWVHDDACAYYAHDGNKNVSEVVDASGDVVAHYEYAPFGRVTVSYGDSAAANPWRFSSEFAEDDLGLVYYNYRHYELTAGRWLGRDSIEEKGGVMLYGFVGNDGVMRTDHLGREFITPDSDGQCPIKCCNNKSVRLVPVWSCKRTLKYTDDTETGPISWYHNITAIYHQYLCCKGPNSDCYGVHAGSKKGDIIPKEPEPSGNCKKLCVCPDEKEKACSGCAKMTEDYHIGPHGMDCQEWVDDVTSTGAK